MSFVETSEKNEKHHRVEFLESYILFPLQRDCKDYEIKYITIIDFIFL